VTFFGEETFERSRTRVVVVCDRMEADTHSQGSSKKGRNDS
jgi:hypothetical protein